MVIPAHTQVQGVVEANRRPGHADRVAEFRFRFTTLIFASNFVAPIQGVLQSIPGAKNIRTHDKDGKLKTVDQTEKVVTPAAAGAVGGAIVGSYRGFGIGLLPGAGLGAALGLGAVLLKRGDEISLARRDQRRDDLAGPSQPGAGPGCGERPAPAAAMALRHLAASLRSPETATRGLPTEKQQKQRCSERRRSPGLLFASIVGLSTCFSNKQARTQRACGLPILTRDLYS